MGKQTTAICSDSRRSNGKDGVLAVTVVLLLRMVCPVFAETQTSWWMNEPERVLTRYDGEEYYAVTGEFGGFDHFELNSERGTAYPAQWTYQYVDEAKRIATYLFRYDVSLKSYCPAYVRPVRMLSYTPSSAEVLLVRNPTPFFGQNTIATGTT